MRGQNHPHTTPKQPPRISFAASRETKQPPTPQSHSTSVPSVPSVVKKTPLTSNPSSTDLGLESPSYKNHKTTITAFRGFRVFRGSNTTPCVPSVKIRVHPWQKKHHSQAILPGQISGWKARATKAHKITTPIFRGFRVFRGPITTPCVSSVKIRVHPWRKKRSHNTKSCVFTNNGVSGICIIFSHRDCVPAFQRRQRTEKTEYREAE